MKKFLCVLFMAMGFLASFTLAACAAAEAEDALRTREQLVEKLKGFIGQSDRYMVRSFRTGFAAVTAKTVSIDCLDNGTKNTTIAWKSPYHRRSAMAVVYTISPDITSGAGQSYKAYPVKEYELHCTIHFISRDNRILEFTLEGEGCIW